MKRLVFFDLDGTILGGVSSENAFFFHLLRHGYIGVKQFLATTYCMVKWLPKFKWHVFIKNKAYLYGLSTEEMEKLAKKFVQEKLIKKLRPELIKRIEQHRQAGDYLILLTGSPTFLAKEFAKYLNMDEVVATDCTHRRGRFTHLLPSQHPYAVDKLILAERLCEKHDAKLSEAYAYGNSINDRFILQGVGHAIAVTPHKSLRRIAKKEGWEIIDV